jgi:hypothetical protein
MSHLQATEPGGRDRSKSERVVDGFAHDLARWRKRARSRANALDDPVGQARRPSRGDVVVPQKGRALAPRRRRLSASWRLVGSRTALRRSVGLCLLVLHGADRRRRNVGQPAPRSQGRAGARFRPSPCTRSCPLSWKRLVPRLAAGPGRPPEAVECAGPWKVDPVEVTLQARCVGRWLAHGAGIDSAAGNSASGNPPRGWR